MLCTRVTLGLLGALGLGHGSAGVRHCRGVRGEEPSVKLYTREFQRGATAGKALRTRRTLPMSDSKRDYDFTPTPHLSPCETSQGPHRADSQDNGLRHG